MFEAFAAPTVDITRKKRFAASTGLSLAVYAVVGAGVVMLASPPVAEKDEDLVDVTFERMIKKEAPPPPPPVDKPPPKAKPRRALVAPTALPDEKPPEADPGTAVAAADIPDPAAAVAAPEPAVVAAPPPPPPKPRPKKAEPVSLPEEAEPPEPDPGNSAPQYPEAARTAGIEGKVILKIVISETGAVIEIKALKGDPILVEAAMASVRSWRFSPAMLDGKPIAVYRIVPVTFTSSVGG